METTAMQNIHREKGPWWEAPIDKRRIFWQRDWRML